LPEREVNAMLTPGSLSVAHQRRLLASARYADKLLSDIEAILAASESRSPFPKYRPDFTPHQARLIRNHIARLRDHLVRVLEGIGVERGEARFGSLHSIRVNLTFVGIAVHEMGPGYLRGYGAFSEETAAGLRGVCAELEGLSATWRWAMVRTCGRGLAAWIKQSARRTC